MSLMLVVTSHIGVACPDPVELHRYALERAGEDGVSPQAYEIARRHAACTATFDFETLLRHLVRRAGCSLIEIGMSSVDADFAVVPESETDIVAVDRRQAG
jgi:hypothetical protein